MLSKYCGNDAMVLFVGGENKFDSTAWPLSYPHSGSIDMDFSTILFWQQETEWVIGSCHAIC